MATLNDSIEIEATPEDVFDWFKNLKTGEEYRAWHPNHVDWYRVKCEGGCVVTAAISFRDVLSLKKLCSKQLEGLKQHMREEGENLKKILESKESD
jgi:hypothetical protein